MGKLRTKHHIILYTLLGMCVVLALAFAYAAESDAAMYAKALDDAYAGALLSSLTQMEQLRANIDKALLSQDEGQSASLVSRIGTDAAAVHSALSALPLAHVAMADAVKLCNQIFDYANTLLSRAGSKLSDEDAQTLARLAEACDALLNALQSAYAQMTAGDMLFAGTGAYMQDASAQARPLETVAESIEYPTLIYDGPFSDAVGEDAPRGLGDRRVTETEALDIALQFVGERAREAQLTQPSGGNIPAYGVRVETDDCVLQLAVTRQGGDILWMFPETADFAVVYGLPECERAAAEFLAAHRFGDMDKTFWQIYGGMATISYAAVQEGIRLYPDLVKVQVRMDTLEVVGIETRHYLTNHTRRAALVPAVGQEEAQGALSEKLSVTAARLCVIPQNKNEYLCWEFTGACAGRTYFVYIDANNGRQRDIQRLVESDNGIKAS